MCRNGDKKKVDGIVAVTVVIVVDDTWSVRVDHIAAAVAVCDILFFLD